MKDILFNLALIDANKFAIEHNLDRGEAGTRLMKDGRGFKYTLIRLSDNKPILTVEFHKSQVPSHIVYKEAHQC